VQRLPRSVTPSNQDVQRHLLEQAQGAAGLADALAAYAAIAPYLPIQCPVAPRVWYATGGNP
jgi:hypothetical protein